MATNSASTEKITISTTPQVAAMLDWLVERGTYGKNRADAAERIISEQLRQFLASETYNPNGVKE